MDINKEITPNIIQYNKVRPDKNPGSFCYVPFLNMLFTQEGIIKSCCYNNKAVLGRYPDQTIMGAWNGEIADQTRNSMVKSNLIEAGCSYCVDLLKQQKYYDIKPTTYDMYKPFLQTNMPVVLEFELKNTCNLECIMCNGDTSSAIRKNRDNLPAKNSPYDNEFVSQIEEVLPFIKEARFFGGEPFLIDIYYEIWEAILRTNPGIRLYVLTNGTIWNEKIAMLIANLNMDLGVSIDAMDKDIFESIRVNAIFEEVMQNIDKMKQVYDEKKPGRAITISATPIEINLFEISKIAKYCNNKGFYLWLSTVNEPSELSLSTISKDKLSEAINDIESDVFPQNTSYETHNKRALEDYVRQLRYWVEK